MSTIADQESHVKESLFQFIKKHIPSADLNVIDDIVLSYVVSILDSVSQDPCFDLDGFIEMMSAYIPEFAHIDAGIICAWILELEAQLSQETNPEIEQDNSSDNDKISLTLQSLTEMLPSIAKGARSHSNSESSESLERSEDRGKCTAFAEAGELRGQCEALHEMFPNSCIMEIKHCVSIAGGDVERAAATLLHRREHDQALIPVGLVPAARAPPIDDAELKNRIIARYSYVDKNAEAKEHKPLTPKIEPKKMVRYRDNKIVSLKGERYTEVPKSGIDEEHLKKPKKQHCP